MDERFRVGVLDQYAVFRVSNNKLGRVLFGGLDVLEKSVSGVMRIAVG
jgi:hypothetical protein